MVNVIDHGALRLRSAWPPPAKMRDLFDVVGRYLGRTEHARRLRLFRAEHVDRLLEHRDVERFRAPRQVLMPRFSSLLYL